MLLERRAGTPDDPVRAPGVSQDLRHPVTDHAAGTPQGNFSHGSLHF
jgi:hypothetical protein